MYGVVSFQESVGALLPSVAASILACFAWLQVCRLACRRADAAHRVALANAPTEAVRYAAACRGVPSDRLWFRSMAVVVVAGLLYGAGYVLEITPASEAERDFIARVIDLANDNPAVRPKAQALAAVMQRDYYVSRQHFQIAERLSHSL